MALQHHRSTKLLINRFESMSTDFTRPWETPPVRNHMAGLTRASLGSPSSPGQNGKDKDRDKEKSPIRQSIISLLSVFKRNALTEKKSSAENGPGPGLERDSRPMLAKCELGPGLEFERNAIETRIVCGSGEKALPNVPSSNSSAGLYIQVGTPHHGDYEVTNRPRGIALFDAPVPPISLADGSPCGSQPKKRQICGVLLYLSQCPDNLRSSQGPTWLPCTATLEEDVQSIRISWSDLSSQEERVSTHIISLARCTDVRSLVASQLEERDLTIPLAGCKDEVRIEDYKVFEILFEGKEREKFAARTVRERARWVSAIWDVVLPSQEPRSSRDQGEESVALETRRPLPVLPSVAKPDGSTTEICRPHSPATPSIYPPTRPISRLSVSSSTSTSRCHSPSIMNLHQKLVVKQRLAEIEGMDVQRSCSASSASSRTASRRGSSRHLDTGGQSAHPCAKGVEQKDKTGDFDQLEIVSPTPTRVCLEEAHTNSPLGNFLASQEHTRPSPSREAGHNTTSNFASLLGFFENNAREHREQVTHLEDRLAGLQDEIQRLPKELSCMIGNSDVNNTHIHQLATKVDRKLETNVDILSTIDDKLTAVASSCQQQASIGSARDKSAAETLRLVDGVRSQLKSNFPAVLARLAQIQDTQERLNEKAKNERPPLAELNKERPSAPVIDLSTVLSKLDAVIALQRKAAAPAGKAGGNRLGDVAGKDIKDQLSNVLSLLDDNNRQRDLHTQQQADSVRYLTELNGWLEAFVNHGTSQIESVAANVEQLCKVLNQGGNSTDIAGHTSLLQDLRALVSDAQMRQQNSAELQNSINALLAAVKNLNISELSSLAQVVERHRQDQVHLFRVMKKELSSEIKGERIRFVEAMKEATSINVQMHVENFKQSLAAEALKVSAEIGRLHQEKQVIESQIQQLLAFHDKQRLRVGQADTRFYQPHLEEYPTLTRQGHLTFHGK